MSQSFFDVFICQLCISTDKVFVQKYNIYFKLFQKYAHSSIPDVILKHSLLIFNLYYYDYSFVNHNIENQKLLIFIREG